MTGPTGMGPWPVHDRVARPAVTPGSAVSAIAVSLLLAAGCLLGWWHTAIALHGLPEIGANCSTAPPPADLDSSRSIFTWVSLGSVAAYVLLAVLAKSLHRTVAGRLGLIVLGLVAAGLLLYVGHIYIAGEDGYTMGDCGPFG